eukprot:Awhi_evm1s11384
MALVLVLASALAVIWYIMEGTGTYVEKGLGDDETLDGILKDLFAADLEPT